MPRSSAVAMGRPELNGFLYAPVGMELSGMTLSVLSALARMGVDPWDEAARLARLPRPDAAEALASIIAAEADGAWPAADAPSIATRLVALLPGTPLVALAAAALPRSMEWRPSLPNARYLLAAAMMTAVLLIVLLSRSG